MPYEDKLQALAHPLRQQILLALRTEPVSVRGLTDRLDASQPVISQHLKVLREAGLVSARPEGMKRIYQIEPEGLTQLRRFLESQWTQLLGDLGADDESGA
ncbi:ArsR/SmtB family transcription factor [Devosia sp.]|uniref:ArsR/SmtB family transcription factor n=1 Tax=Devosia sp. TaxID=1871048 RepID=UPI003A936AE6